MEPKKAFYNLTPLRQQEIVDETVKLFANNDYEAVTVRLICQRLSINLNTFYRYFPSKDDLYMYLYLQLAERTDSTASGVWRMEDFALSQEQMRGFYTEEELCFLGSWRNLPEHMLQKIIFSPELNPQEMTLASIERGIADGSMRKNLDVDLVAYLFHTVSYLILHYARIHHMDDITTLDQLRHYVLYDFFSYGLRGQKKLAPEKGPDK